MIVAVAEESRGAEHARQWIEQAKAEYWCLIDAGPSRRRSVRHGERAAGGLDRCDGPHCPSAGDRRLDRSFPADGPCNAHACIRAPGGATGCALGVSGCGARLGADRAGMRCRTIRRGTHCHGSHRRSHWHRRISDWACGCAGMATPARAMFIWRKQVGCIRIYGTSGASPPISTRSARQAARHSGSVSRRWGISLTIRHRS